jgi:hypothetical protein
MKYLIIALISSAYGRETLSPAINKSIITDIETTLNTEGKLCNYYGSENPFGTDSQFLLNFKVCDSCGKFQIGDTLKLTK